MATLLSLWALDQIFVEPMSWVEIGELRHAQIVNQDGSKPLRDGTFIKWMTIAYLSMAATWMNIPHAEQALLTLMGLDLLMGAWGALAKGQFSAKLLFSGIGKKCRTLLFLAAAIVFENLFTSDLSIDLHKPVTYALCIYELTSLVENYVKYGGHVPPIFMTALDKLRGLINGNSKPAAEEANGK